MASLKVPNLGKIKNQRQRNRQNSSKRIKRIDLRQNLMKNRSKDSESLVYYREEMKMRCKECADFYTKKLKTKSVLEIQTQVIL
jgi:hypothetical protein